MERIKKIKAAISNKFSTVLKFDLWIISKIMKVRNKYLTFLLKNISRLSDWWFLTLIAILIGIFWNIEIGIFLSTALIIQVIFQKIIKNIITRKRPYIKHRTTVKRLIIPPDRYSFPSGHTAGAFVTFFVVNNFFFEISLFILSIAILIGFSRIYLGVHYLTDVLFGILLAFISFEISKYLYTYIFNLIKLIIPYLLHSQFFQAEYRLSG
ncbi:MAG: phosphatase PAP2 family protein [Brevinematales bacterium]|nr:phosphatase PAP2 family protein [Brevinematales bacterium]